MTDTEEIRRDPWPNEHSRLCGRYGRAGAVRPTYIDKHVTPFADDREMLDKLVGADMICVAPRRLARLRIVAIRDATRIRDASTNGGA